MHEKIVTCSCGRKYRVQNMTVRDQSKCPICLMDDKKGADQTEREVEERIREQEKRADGWKK